MTFKEIQDAVILDRFNETQRSAIKFAINSRYGRVWALEPWSFKRVQVPVPILPGLNEVSLEALGLQSVEAVHTYSSASQLQFDRLSAMYPDRFVEERYLGGNDKPYSWSIHTGALRVNSTALLGYTVYALGQKKWVPLVDDTDEPLLPEEYHFILVVGAAADMLLRESDPTWQGEEKAYNDQVNEMMRSYMSQQPMARTAYPAWP
jgi:hypothetical protein